MRRVYQRFAIDRVIVDLGIDDTFKYNLFFIPVECWILGVGFDFIVNEGNSIY
jgi:hypothetical protein